MRDVFGVRSVMVYEWHWQPAHILAYVPSCFLTIAMQSFQDDREIERDTLSTAR